MKKDKCKSFTYTTRIFLLSGILLFIFMMGCCAGPISSANLPNYSNLSVIKHPPGVVLKPDLQAPLYYEPSQTKNVQRGNSFRYLYRVRNDGLVGVGPFKIDIDMTTCKNMCNNLFYYGPIIGSVSVPSFGGNKELQGYLDITIPADIAPGLYYFHEILDPDNKISERNESNNYITLYAPQSANIII